MIPLSDFSQTGSFILLGAGQLVTWILIAQDKRQAAEERSAEDAATTATAAAALKEAASSNDRLAQALEKLEEWARSHELDDARRWASSEALQRQQAETNTRLASIAEDLSRRITNVALHHAPEATPREVPATRQRR